MQKDNKHGTVCNHLLIRNTFLWWWCNNNNVRGNMNSYSRPFKRNFCCFVRSVTSNGPNWLFYTKWMKKGKNTMYADKDFFQVWNVFWNTEQCFCLTSDNFKKPVWACSKIRKLMRQKKILRGLKQHHVPTPSSWK